MSKTLTGIIPVGLDAVANCFLLISLWPLALLFLCRYCLLICVLNCILGLNNNTMMENDWSSLMVSYRIDNIYSALNPSKLQIL